MELLFVKVLRAQLLRTGNKAIDLNTRENEKNTS